MAYHDSKKLQTFIAKKLSRSRDAVQNFLKNPKKDNLLRIQGLKYKLGPRDKRRAISKVMANEPSSSMIRLCLQLNVSTHQIRPLLRSDPTLSWHRVKKAPPLTQNQKNRRLEFARSHVIWSMSKCESVLFPDEN